MLKYVLLYLLIVNILGFIAMGIDKLRAKKHRWRIPEKTLFLLSLIGGSIGTFAGMWLFHHKTRHWYFVIGMPIILLLHICMAGGVIYYCNDYYRTDRSVKKELKSDESISVMKLDDGTYVFEPNQAESAMIFYPGGKVEYTAYAPLMEEMAKDGMMCILPKMPVNLAVLDSDKADDLRAQFSGIKHWYIGGHSLGGAMAASYVKKHTDEYEGLLLLGAYSTKNLKKSGLKVLSIYGSEDGVLDREKYEDNKKHLPEDMIEIVIEGGCHAGFGMYGPQEGDGTPAITAQEQIVLTSKEVRKIFR